MSISVCYRCRIWWDICTKSLHYLCPLLSFFRFITCTFFVIIAFVLLSSRKCCFCFSLLRSSLLSRLMIYYPSLFYLYFSFSLLYLFISDLFPFSSTKCLLLLCLLLPSIAWMWFSTGSWCRMSSAMLWTIRLHKRSPEAQSTCGQWSTATTAIRMCSWA